MPLSFFETWQLITCENGKEDKQFDNCNCLKCVYFSVSFFCHVQDSQLASTTQKKSNDQQMINGRCFLLPNVSHYDPIQHHLSSAWSISSIRLSISVQHRFSICSPIDFCFFFFFVFIFTFQTNELHNMQPTSDLWSRCIHWMNLFRSIY